MKKKKKKNLLWKIQFLIYIYNKLILKLDKKYNELVNARKKEFHSKSSIGELFLSNYNYNLFMPPLHHK